MIIGIPREVKGDEHRVSLTPDKVDLLVRGGHQVLIETSAGAAANFSDDDYLASGATVIEGPQQVFGRADIVVKVKEPQPQEYAFFREDQIIFTFLHLAAEPSLTKALLAAKVTGIAYETVVEEDGNLPLLYPMSEIAGTLAPQLAAHLLQNTSGGPGKLLGGVPGTRPIHMTIVGGGTVGFNAARLARALGAHTTILDINLGRLRQISLSTSGEIETVVATPANVADLIEQTDVAVGAVLVPGASAPKVITTPMVESMREGSLIIDVAIDQGGSVEGIRPTTHKRPIYSCHGVNHYAVPNMPGIVGNTSSISLSNGTYGYLLRLANSGIVDTIRGDKVMAAGVNTLKGQVTHKAVANSLGVEHVPVEQALDV